MRLFVALNLPGAERERLRRATASLRDAQLPLRWVAADSIHLTLKFLGEVGPEKLAGIEAALAAAAAGSQPFVVKLGGFGGFPTLRRLRVLWLGVESTPELRCLKTDVEYELARLGFQREVQAFTPHLTLARAAGHPGAGEFRTLEPLLSQVRYQGTLAVESLDLMRSQLGRGGARYERVQAVELGGESQRDMAVQEPA